MDYHNGKIYVLRSNQTDDVYIGSTTTKLSKRFHQHKQNFKKWKNGKYHYVTSFELMKYDDCYIELLQGYSCENRMELRKREGEFIRSMDCLNRRIAGRTDKEYYHINKDKMNKVSKEKHNCECGGKYTRGAKAKHLKTKKHLSKIPIINVVQELV